MKRLWGFLLISLVCLACSRSPYRYNVAICAIFKNEAPWLKEWLVYHHDVLGVEHFYLYDNDSTDNYREVLQPFIDKGIVELIEWKGCEEHEIKDFRDDSLVYWVYYQLGAYHDCFKNRALGQAKWVAVLDIDEFIVPVQGKESFYECLRTAEKRHKGSIKFTWRTFGTSNVWDLKPGELLTQQLMLRAPDDDVTHRCGKSMHRPEAVFFCHVHEAGQVIANRFYPGKLTGKFRFRHANPDEIRVHHYWARTEKACREKRGEGASANSHNRIVDRSIEPYLPALKEAMAR